MPVFIKDPFKNFLYQCLKAGYWSKCNIDNEDIMITKKYITYKNVIIYIISDYLSIKKKIINEVISRLAETFSPGNLTTEEYVFNNFTRELKEFLLKEE